MIVPFAEVARPSEIPILEGMSEPLARWSDLVPFGSFLVPMYGGVLQRSAGCVPAGCLAEAFAVPFAEASALVVDKVEGFPRSVLRKLLRCLRGGQRPRC